MKRTYKWLIAVMVIGFFGVSGLVLAADVPKGKEVLKIDLIKGKKGKVKFSHAKHSKEYKTAKGKAISCKMCHHTLKGPPKNPKKVKKCSECHVAEGQTQKEFKGKKAAFLAVKKGKKIDKKSVIFHKTCVKCHKAAAKKDPELKKKKIAKCKNCHSKKK